MTSNEPNLPVKLPTPAICVSPIGTEITDEGNVTTKSTSTGETSQIRNINYYLSSQLFIPTNLINAKVCLSGTLSTSKFFFQFILMREIFPSVI